VKIEFRTLTFDAQTDLIRKHGADSLTRDELLQHVRAGIDKMTRETRNVGERLAKMEARRDTPTGLGAALLQKLVRK
jgi:hypothetical protein